MYVRHLVRCVARCGSHRGNGGISTKIGILLLASVATLAAPASSAGADEAKPLRLCADPTNLPFSSDDPATPGIYLELGQQLGKALGRPIVYDWYKSYFGKRTVRVTLLGKHCDAMIGLPNSEDFMGPAVIFSKPIAQEGYALVSKGDRTIAGVDDLKQLRVAVQYQTTPQNLLALRDDITLTTVLTPEEGISALDRGAVDVAFVWGPVAGWLNATKYQGRFRIRTVEGEGLLWPVAIGFAKGSTQLRDQIDDLLPGLQPTVLALAKKYGFPIDTPIKLTANAGAAATHAAADAAAEKHTVGQAAATPAPTPAVATTSTEPDAANAGREIFNGTCAHCHGPDAIQSERRIDLRRLKLRYGDSMRDTFWLTVHEGRPSKGMPAWKDVFDDTQLNEVYAYLATIQSN